MICMFLAWLWELDLASVLPRAPWEVPRVQIYNEPDLVHRDVRNSWKGRVADRRLVSWVWFRSLAAVPEKKLLPWFCPLHMQDTVRIVQELT